MVDVVIIGGGASGLFAACRLAVGGASVVLLEKNERLGKKLAITGRGRCNLTNCCDYIDVIKNIPTNGEFLYSAVSRCSPDDVMLFFEDIGVKLKVERGKRVFPVSDKADEVVSALIRQCDNNGVCIINETACEIGYINGRTSFVKTNTQTVNCKNVVVATGGLSYPQTGSTGDGYLLAKKAGHKITSLSPSLVPIVTVETWPTLAQGLSLKNVKLDVEEDNKEVFSSFGELLFTHFGISGPLALSASAHMRPMQCGRYKLLVDLKPALSEEKLEKRLIREILANSNQNISNFLRKLIPKKLVIPFCELLHIDCELKVNQFTKQKRQELAVLLKRLPLTAKEFRPIKDAIITSGGVDLSEVNPKTMQSKLKGGLYFIGEILDVDGYTGGFNLQIAWSTAASAADDILCKLIYK